MFLEQSNDRKLPADYRGDVLVWDIDKTYLDTSFSSIRGLIAIPLEFAIDKTSIPGAVHLIRALRHGAEPGSAFTPLYFVSGRQPQLRRVIEQKMTLDGVDFDGITFKDQWGLLRAGRPRDIKAQVGYKVQALLLYRRELPDGARYLMFGDDVEADAESFLLFGKICGGLRDGPLGERLRAANVAKADAEQIVRIASTIPVTEDPVERVFILLTRAEPEKYAGEPRVVASRSYLQTALVLAEMGKIQPATVSAVARDLRRNRIAEEEIARQLEDAELRLGVRRELTLLARQ
jgi:hypothetical protein